MQIDKITGDLLAPLTVGTSGGSRPEGREVDARTEAQALGLSIYKQSDKPKITDTFKVCFRNRVTGELLSIDPLEARMARLRKRLKFFSAWADEVEEHHNVHKILVTLTYRPGEKWEARDLTEFMRKIKRYLGGRLYGYFSVAEMQERGAVHYHVVLVVEKWARIPKPDEEGYWTKGSTRVERVRKIYAYLGKYLQKDEQKAEYPKGIRMFSMSLYVLKDEWSSSKFSSWVYEKINALILTVEDKVERMNLLALEGLKKVTGGYVCAGHFIESPYVMMPFQNKRAVPCANPATQKMDADPLRVA